VGPDKFLSYHFIMFIASVYFGMLLTDWGAPPSAVQGKFNSGYTSAWVQMATNWICAILYLWSLIASKVCPNRDFS